MAAQRMAFAIYPFPSSIGDTVEPLWSRRWQVRTVLKSDRTKNYYTWRLGPVVQCKPDVLLVSSILHVIGTGSAIPGMDRGKTDAAPRHSTWSIKGEIVPCEIITLIKYQGNLSLIHSAPWWEMQERASKLLPGNRFQTDVKQEAGSSVDTPV